MPLKIPCKNIIDSPQGISVKIGVLSLVSIGVTSWNCWPYCALQSKRFELNKCGWPALSASSPKATSCFFREFSWWWCLGLSQVEISTLFCRSLLCIWTKSMKGSISTRYLILWQAVILLPHSFALEISNDVGQFYFDQECCFCI